MIPEEVIVLETVGAVDNFIGAVRNIEGLEWLGEIEEEDIPPDDDFFVADRDGTARTDKLLRGRLFLVLSNNQALQQMLSLWNLWKAGQELPWGFGKWSDLFSQLRDVRPWGARDRLHETGVLDDWRERVEHNAELIPCEIELWFRADHRRRRAARDRVAVIVQSLKGAVRNEALIEEIGYHALLAQLPIGSVRPLLEETGQESSLIQCEQIQFFRASGQMAGIVHEDERTTDARTLQPLVAALGEPVVALFDGLPLQGHRRLSGRLVVDDPDGFEADYQAAERRHGTAMASLIIHGDIEAAESPINRLIYVRPILRPDERDWKQPRQETAPENSLVVDLIHRAVRRLFEGDGDAPAVARQVCVINLSIGIRDRLFESTMSPLARLLDWLAWKYQVLFVVSAGNHAQSIACDVPRNQVAAMSPQDLQAHLIRAVATDARHRRLLSPAEAVNALTVGAVHSDASTGQGVSRAIQPYCDDNLPSLINAQGMGYRRAIKPEILVPGGRVVILEGLQRDSNATFDVYTQSRQPGQCVAAPGPTPGDLSYTWYARGTSNAAALASRTASRLYDVLEELRQGSGGDIIEAVPYAVWLKALLVHGANWGTAGDILRQVLLTPRNSRQFKEYITRLIGYGMIDPVRVSECSEHRVTALGGGLLQNDQAHIHRFPLPPSLSGQRCWRRLVITLAWITPVNPIHQSWRRADLWFTPPVESLQVTRTQADWRAVQRGTVQHEILEGERAAAFVDGDNLEIQVSCRSDAGVLEDAVPYAVAATIEVAEEIGVDIYSEVAVRVHAARVRVASTE
ncbi:MAG: S8 family peptidase [Acidobacteria bacterium]|nr:S8 family peptidase [Acidobacteriota bacterium]